MSSSKATHTIYEARDSRETFFYLTTSKNYIHNGYTRRGQDPMSRIPTVNSPSGVAGNDPALTPAQFHILLTLADGSRHGYGIMQEIRERTGGALELGPGTLYRSIKQLLGRGLIAEQGLIAGEGPIAEQGLIAERGPIVESEAPATGDARASGGRGPDDRRRPYCLTPAGKIRLREEAHRLRALVRWAEEAMVLEGGQS